MLSNNQKKLIRSLHQKKYRSNHSLFLAEGHKIVSDLVAAGSINPDNLHLLAANKSWLHENQSLISDFNNVTVEASSEDLKKVTALITPPDVIAVLKIPHVTFNPGLLLKDYSIVLDAVRDPGNLGTIIRTANWFGVKNIICSEDSVDIYNNKVVQASMGSIMHTLVFYQPLDLFFQAVKKTDIPVFATMLKGTNLYKAEIKRPAILVFGNESSGISSSLKKYFTQSISIPGSKNEKRVESLNVAAAVSSMLTECRRKDFYSSCWLLVAGSCWFEFITQNGS